MLSFFTIHIFIGVMYFCIYFSMLQGLVDFDGYYLESDPCLVCNNPEVPYTVSLQAK